MLFFGVFFIRGATGLRPLCIIKVVHVQYNRSVGTRIHSSHFVHARDTERTPRDFLASLCRQFVDFSPMEMICGLKFSI